MQHAAIYCRLSREDGDNIEEMFELYKNDEAGEYLKKADAKLLRYREI